MSHLYLFMGNQPPPPQDTLLLGPWVKAQLQKKAPPLCPQMTLTWLVPSALTHLLEPEAVIEYGLDRLGLWCSFWPSLFQSPFNTSFYSWEYFTPDSAVHPGFITPAVPGTSAPGVHPGAPGPGVLQNVATLVGGNRKAPKQAFTCHSRVAISKAEASGTSDSNPTRLLTNCVTVLACHSTSLPLSFLIIKIEIKTGLVVIKRR